MLYEIFPLSKILEKNNVNYELVKQWKYWVENFVGVNSNLLNRSGAVCPCVPKALKDDIVYISIIGMELVTQKDIIDNIIEYINWFKLYIPDKNLEIQTFISLSLLYPKALLTNTKVSLTEIHSLLKPIVISQGLMIGEFIPDYTKSSIRNKDFYPLNSPVSALVIRKISNHDKKFVIHDKNLTDKQKDLCLKHIESFLK